MIVLGFDTATPATAVALLLADGSIREERDDPLQGERPGHSTRLLPLAHDLLGDVGLAWHDVQRIAVGIGPGTFTGLRIGVATARGLAQASGAELCGVSSLKALAAGADGTTDSVLAAIDARRGEVFAAAYGPCDAAGDRRELIGPSVLPPDRLSGFLEGAAKALGAAGGTDGPAPAVEPGRRTALEVRRTALGEHRTALGERRTALTGRWTALGDGALRYRDALSALGVEVPEESAPAHAVSGAAICELGAQLTPEGLTVVPHYLRRPDAELSLRDRGRGKGANSPPGAGRPQGASR